MQAASKNLTPVSLELGGKSPVIVESDVNTVRYPLIRCPVPPMQGNGPNGEPQA